MLEAPQEWQWRAAARKRSISMRIDNNLWLEFKRNARLHNCRTEAQLLEWVIKRALKSPAELLRLRAKEKAAELNALLALVAALDKEEKKEELEEAPIAKFS